MMRLLLLFLLGVICAAPLGCVKRQIIITSEPGEAEVYLNGRHVGKTPARIGFEFYGMREVTLRKHVQPSEGFYYESLNREIDVAAPWYEYFPIDVIADVVIPFTIENRHEFHFKLVKRSPLPDEREKEYLDLINRSKTLRARIAEGIGGGR